MPLVKICGLRDAQTALETAKAGADFIGMVFAESRRQVTPEQCIEIVAALREHRREKAVASFDAPVRGDVTGNAWFGAWSEAIEDSLPVNRPLIVGVFAGQPLEDVNSIAENAGLDLVQLSGGESWEFVSQVVRPVIKVMHVVPGDFAADILDNIRPVSAALMLENGAGGAKGGTGQSFDWDVARAVARKHPFLLAGGLNIENIEEAVAHVEPWAVDVSSGVETDGRKDLDKIRAFIRAAKGAGHGR